MYWPEIGRFISADSNLGWAADARSLNRYSYVLNNPFKYTDPSGRTAVQVGVAGTVVLPFGIVIAGSIGFAFDDKGNIGVYAAGGPMTGVGLHASAGGTFQVSNANEIADLRGPFAGISAGGGWGPDATGDAFAGTGRKGELILGGGVTGGAGAGAGVAGGVTTTKVKYLKGNDPAEADQAGGSPAPSPPSSQPSRIDTPQAPAPSAPSPSPTKAADERKQ